MPFLLGFQVVAG